MATINLGRVVGQDGADGEDGRGIVSVEKTGTQGLVDTYTITYTDGTTSTFEVTNGQSGGGGTSNYNELTNKPSINGVTLIGNKTSSDLGVQDALVSGTNIKTINNQSILGSGNIDIQGDIAVEATARANADTNLQNQITQEAQARAAADTAINGRLDKNVSDLKSAFGFDVDTVHNGDGESTYFIQGARSSSNPSVVSPSTTRCTSGLLFHLYPNDTITISNIKSGHKAALASSTGVDSGWQTSDYTYRVRAEMYMYINEATSSGSGTITPSDITTTITVVDGSSLVKKLENTVDGYTENLSFAYTSGSAIEKSIYYSAPVGSDVELSISGYSGTVRFLIYYTDNTNEQYDSNTGGVNIKIKKPTVRFVVYKSSADASGSAVFTLNVLGIAHDIVYLNNKLIALNDLLTVINQGIAYNDGTTGRTGKADRSQYIKVNKGETITYNLMGISDVNAIIAFYDETFAYEKANSVQGSTDVQIGTYTVPKDGYIMVMNRHIHNGSLYFDEYIPDILVPFVSKLTIPSYYASHMASKLQTINEHSADIGDNGDGFVWITDYHIESNTNNSPRLVKNVLNNSAIPRVVFGGDAFDSTDTVAGAVAEIMAFQEKFKEHEVKPFDFVIGNHEYNNTSGDTPSKQLTIGEVFGLTVKPSENEYTISSDLNAYYRDNARQKIRYFYLACDYVAWVRDNQIAWIAGQFENVPSGWSVFVFTHRGLNGAMDALGSGFDEVGKAMDALKVKGTYTYNGASYDYSGTNVTVIGSICGHTHIDGSYTSAQGIPHICTTTDAYALQQGSLARLLNTTSEQAFDVVQIDKTNRKIYCTRIGAGADREFSF